MVNSAFLRSTTGHLRRGLPLALPLLGALALALYAYRGLPAQPFVADDYQWLLSVRDLDLGQVLGTAFDAGAQTHFYRPLVWLLFWGQLRLFGLDPRGYHLVTLALHLTNAVLLGALVLKLRIVNGELKKDQSPRHAQFSIFNSQFFPALLAGAIVLLHPAPFEAVAWISAQSELLAAALLLAMLHLWPLATTDRRPPTTDHRPPTTEEPGTENRELESAGRQWWNWGRIILATVALGLALLAKESAVIGLPLIVLMGFASRITFHASRFTHHVSRITFHASRFVVYLPPVLLTVAYIALQVAVERRNYLLQAGGYGFGPQLALNPLRSLALIVAPLPGTEHANAAWLAPLGGLIALLLLALCILRGASAGRIILALLLTLLPTAPFVSPPDSRYLYLPVMAAAPLVALGWRLEIGDWRLKDNVRRYLPSSILHPLSSSFYSLSSVVGGRWSVVGGRWLLLAILAWAAAVEVGAREQRFAMAGGSGGSLLQAVESVCVERRDWRRIIIVEPPLAAPHVEAVVKLACGPEMRTKIMPRDQIPSPLKPLSVVIGFHDGRAAVEQTS